MGYGQTIKAKLREKKMTIKELAKASGISIYTLYTITKNDSKRLQSNTLLKISEALDIDPHELAPGYVPTKTREKEEPLKKVLIAIPTLNSVPIEFFLSVLSLKTTEGTEISVVANSLVYQARNQLALKAIDENFDYVFWIDSDMVFPSDTLVRLIKSAEEHEADYVAGLAFWRHKPTNPVVYDELVWKQDPETGLIDHGARIWKNYPKDCFFECSGTGMGCVLVRTSVIRKVAETFKCSPFEPMPFMSEDLSFCWRLKRIGVKMYCDSRIKVGHVGQYIFDEQFYLEQENEQSHS